MTFEWSDVPDTQFEQDMNLMLKSRLMAHRARRKILDWKLEEAIANVQKWEIERAAVSEREDKIADEIERRKIPQI